MRTILFTMFFCFCVNFGFSQNILEETGDKFVKHDNIERAIEMYLRAYERDSSDVISAKIAYCYSTQKNVKKTVYWYDKVSNLQSLPNEHLYYYTEALLGLARYEDADRWFKLYNANVIKDHRNKRRKPSKKYFEDYFRDSILYTLTNLDQINTKYAEFSPVLYNEKLLVFCSDRPSKETEGLFKKKGEEIVDLFQVKVSFKDTSFSKLDRFHKELKTKHHAGPVIFSKDREQVIFTRNTFIPSKNEEEEEGVNKLHLYHAIKENGRWQKAISLPFNQEEYSIGHPAVNEAFDVMYFASDMSEGGFGATDIYKVSFKDGVWGKPQNLGPTINTKGDEMFPTLFNDNTLFFSSSGHNSMGGLDLFEAELKNEHVESIKNMGFPLNSLDDDFGLIWNEDRTHGLFSSTRAEGKGSDDLYLLSSVYKHKKVLIAGQTFIKNEGELDDKKQRTICKIVVWSQQTNRPVDTVYTSKFGQFKVLLDLGMTYNFVAKRDGVRKDLLVDLQDKKNYPKHVDVILERPIFVERDPAMYDVDFIEDSSLVASTDTRKVGTSTNTSNRPKASLPKGNTKKIVEFLLHSDENDKPLANVEVYILSKENNKFYKYRSNEHGYVKMPVLDNEQTFYLHRKGLVPECVKIDTRKLEDGFYISDKPIKMVSSTPHEKYSFEKIYYEYNKATLNAGAKKDLNKLVEYLKLHKSLKVELSSHTDSRGGNDFNMKLSQKRSNIAVAYVVNKGIEKERIKAVGYGEEQVINECKDKVPCSEEKHKENRRTKIKIVGTIQDNTKFDSKKLLDSSEAPIIKVVKTQ